MVHTADCGILCILFTESGTDPAANRDDLTNNYAQLTVLALVFVCLFGLVVVVFETRRRES